MMRWNKNIKRMICASLLTVVFSGCGNNTSQASTSESSSSEIISTDALDDVFVPVETEMYSGNGWIIVGPKEMEENDVSDREYDIFLMGEDVAIFAFHENVEEIKDLGYDVTTVEEYAEFWADLYKEEEGYEGFEKPSYDVERNLYVTYSYNDNGTEYFYYTVFKQNTDDDTVFGAVTYACLNSDKQDYSGKFASWAKSTIY